MEGRQKNQQQNAIEESAALASWEHVAEAETDVIYMNRNMFG